MNTNHFKNTLVGFLVTALTAVLSIGALVSAVAISNALAQPDGPGLVRANRASQVTSEEADTAATLARAELTHAEAERTRQLAQAESAERLLNIVITTLLCLGLPLGLAVIGLMYLRR